MAIKVDASNMTKAINEQLEKYSAEVMAELKAEAESIAGDGVAELRKGGPYQGGKASGYNSGWVSEVNSSVAGFTVTIRNRKAPGLTHLLERGHALRQGGRARAFPHIGPVEEKLTAEYTRKAREVLKDG